MGPGLRQGRMGWVDRAWMCIVRGGPRGHIGWQGSGQAGPDKYKSDDVAVMI